MTIRLINLISEYQNGNDEAFLQLLDTFKFTINKLSRKLGYDGSESDLVIHLIEIVKYLDLNKLRCKSDGAIINYIYLSLKNKYNYLYKKKIKFSNENIEFNDEMQSNDTYLICNDVEIYSLLNCLNNIQKKIVIDKYINNLTETEISNNLGISRQSVYKNKIKALSKLKKYI